MEIFNYKQFITEAKRFKDTGQIDLFAGSGTEYDSSPGIAAHLVTNLATQSQPQVQLEPEEPVEQLGTQSNTQELVDSDKKEICELISKQGPFLYKPSPKGLGFQEAVEEVLGPSYSIIDYNPKKQDILKILYDTGRFRSGYLGITLNNGYYESDRLKEVKQILDQNGDYDPVNKLNTNWSDIAELIYDIMDKDGQVVSLKGLNYYQMRNRLVEYFGGKVDPELLKGFNLKKYIINNRAKTLIGEEAENFVKECFYAKGLECVFQGGDGDPIDMVYGIDLILHNPTSNKYYLTQVKSEPAAALEASNDWRYKNLDFYCAPFTDGDIRRTILYTKENKSGVIFSKKARKSE